MYYSSLRGLRIMVGAQWMYIVGYNVIWEAQRAVMRFFPPQVVQPKGLKEGEAGHFCDLA